MTGQRALRDVVREMLRFARPAAARVDQRDRGFAVIVGKSEIAFGRGVEPVDLQLERLATKIEQVLAYDRAQAMLAAIGRTEGPLPLWLVTGSSVLASWLSWSRSESVFRRRLAFSDEPDGPIVGTLDRRARQNLGQAAVKIRVRHGLAVADKIELPGRLRCVAALGKEATVRIEGNPLPDTLIAALSDDPRRNDRRRIGEIVDHPFFTASDLRLLDIRNDGNAVVIEVESQWGPLGRVPDAAWAVVPHDADPVSPWRATPREVAELYRLVDAGRAHNAST